MQRLTYLVGVLALVAVISACERDSREPAGKANANAELDELIEDYVASYWDAYPGRATRAGVRGYDHRLRAMSTDDIEAEAQGLRKVIERLTAIDPENLDTADHKVDWQLLGQHARVRLAEIERLPRWRREPKAYVPFDAFNNLILDEFRPAGERARTLRARLLALPRLLREAEANLENPPAHYTQTSIDSAKAQRPFYRNTIAAFAEQVPDQAEALNEAAATALEALNHYIDFLQNDLLPRSKGELAVGEDMYEFYLKEIHGIDMTVEELIALGEQYFDEIEQALEEQANRIDPELDWVRITEKIRNNHPEADELLDAYCREIQRTRSHIINKDLVTVPANAEVRCIHSDPSQRAFSPFGVFRTPAPFADEKIGYFILHPIPDNLTPEREEELLRAHDYTWIQVIAPHETYPGHHLQALRAQENPRILRKIYSTPVFSEGWGLYTEQLMHETGFFDPPEETRLTQLRLRLWRAARVILDAKLHTGKISFEEARQFLADHVRMDYESTAGEVNIYAHRPSYAIGYVIGFYEIMRLRDQYRQKQGSDFDLRDFHDRMLTLGSIPFPQVRQLLEGNLAR